MERVRIMAREKGKTGAKHAPVQHSQETSEPGRRRGQKKFTEAVTVRYGTALYGTIQNIIESAHAAQDFTYTSPADLIRAALQAYKEGMELTELAVQGDKTETTLRMPGDLKNFYQSLPARMRTQILERAIRTFIKNM